jgi:hypothetical protein
MREIRLSGSEGGGAGNSTGPPYPYREPRPLARGRGQSTASGVVPCAEGSSGRNQDQPQG